MRQRIKHLCLFTLLVISACGEKGAASSCERLLSKTVYEDINATIELSAPSDTNSFKFDDSIEIVVDNNSSTNIEVKPDNDLRVFWWKESSWNEVDNAMDYLSVVHWIAPKSSDGLGMGAYAILLSTPKPENPIRLCVTLEAIHDPDGARSRVAAYMELEVNP